MKRILLFVPAALGVLLLCACVKTAPPEPPTEAPLSAPTAEEKTEEETKETTTENAKEERMLTMTIGETPVTVLWENNAAVKALKALCADAPLEISMEMYGGFEQVGELGQALPREDRQTKTSPGDIVLYAGDKLVVFYGENSWSYTRLGKIADKTPEELIALLGGGDVTLTLETG